MQLFQVLAAKHASMRQGVSLHTVQQHRLWVTHQRQESLACLLCLLQQLPHYLQQMTPTFQG